MQFHIYTRSVSQQINRPWVLDEKTSVGYGIAGSEGMTARQRGSGLETWAELEDLKLESKAWRKPEKHREYEGMYKMLVQWVEKIKGE